MRYTCAGCKKKFTTIRGFHQHQAHNTKAREEKGRPNCPGFKQTG